MLEALFREAFSLLPSGEGLRMRGAVSHASVARSTRSPSPSIPLPRGEGRPDRSRSARNTRLTTNGLHQSFLGLAALLWLFALAPAQAATRWEQLSPAQQQQLEPVRQDWATLPGEKQDRLARGAERWLLLDPEQREHARARLERWQRLSPEERRQLRERRDHYRKLKPEQRERLRERAEKFRSLPPEEQERIRARHRELHEQRRALRAEERRLLGCEPGDPCRPPPSPPPPR